MVSLNSISRFHASLHQWYANCGRHDLPWRTTSDPYAIYLSEVMLQQTQVKTVLERYYFPFLERFPTLQALADANQEEVLSLWQGLGYYNRAINLHKAAKAAAPSLPNTYDELIALPGIGQNTAHAILAFAFHQPVAVLEANVKRIIHRVFAKETASPNELWELAGQLVDKDQPFNYNQAMMDIGSAICTPKTPNCPDCPANTICKGKDKPQAYPQKKVKKATPVRHKNILVFRDANARLHMSPRTTRFLNGLYGFVEIDGNERSYKWQGQTYQLKAGKLLGEVSQTYSHFQLQAKAYLIELEQKQNGNDWHNVSKLDALPMSRADEKVVSLLKHQTAS